MRKYDDILHALFIIVFLLLIEKRVTLEIITALVKVI